VDRVWGVEFSAHARGGAEIRDFLTCSFSACHLQLCGLQRLQRQERERRSSVETYSMRFFWTPVGCVCLVSLVPHLTNSHWAHSQQHHRCRDEQRRMCSPMYKGVEKLNTLLFSLRPAPAQLI
jgi:hypothetical protein